MSLAGLEPDETAFDVFNRSRRIVVKTGLPLLEPVSRSYRACAHRVTNGLKLPNVSKLTARFEISPAPSACRRRLVHLWSPVIASNSLEPQALGNPR